MYGSLVDLSPTLCLVSTMVCVPSTTSSSPLVVTPRVAVTSLACTSLQGGVIQYHQPWYHNNHYRIVYANYNSDIPFGSHHIFSCSFSCWVHFKYGLEDKNDMWACMSCDCHLTWFGLYLLNESSNWTRSTSLDEQPAVMGRKGGNITVQNVHVLINVAYQTVDA